MLFIMTFLGAGAATANGAVMVLAVAEALALRVTVWSSARTMLWPRFALKRGALYPAKY